MPETNPYQAPTASLVSAPDELSQHYLSCPIAGNGARLTNFLIDYLCSTLFTGLLLLIYELRSPGAIESMSGLVERVLGVLGMALFYVVFETLFGRTPGKFVTGTRVIRNDGGSPTLKQIAGRSFARFVPFEPLSMFSSTGAWHDTWSKTYVVKVRGH